MSILDTEIRVVARCREALDEWGIRDQNCTMVLFAMCDADLNYRHALESYAEHRGISPEILHSNLCYTMLAAHVDVRPETLFRFLKWQGEQINAD